MRRNPDRDGGFTYVEVSIILLALAILVGVLLPNIGNFNALARKVRLKEDLGVLCASLKVMLDDIGDSAFFSSGYAATAAYSSASFGASSSYSSASSGAWSVDSSTAYVRDDGAWCEDCERGGDAWCENCDMPHADCGRDCMDDCNENCTHGVRPQLASVTTQTWQYDGTQAAIGRTSAYASSSRSFSSVAGGFWGVPVGLLVGDGEVPVSAVGPTEWQLPLGARFHVTTHGYFPVALDFVVDSFAGMLIHQDPTYGRFHATSVTGWGRGAGAYGIPDTTFRWRGPYIADSIAADPWGNRYMANVYALHAPTAATYPATVGAHGWRHGRYVESFHSAVVCYSAGPNEAIETRFDQPFGWYTGGDDVTAVLAGAGGIR